MAMRAAGPTNDPGPPLLSVVIPVYNERGTIAAVLRRIWAQPVAKEVVVVDDGSTDGTRELLRALADRPDVRLLLHERNLGKGAALRSALDAARGQFVLVQDADLEYDPADYGRLLGPLLAGRADAVYGSRFLGRAHPAAPWWHRLGNRSLTMLSNLCTGLRLTDMETGFKVFRREVVVALLPALREDRFGIEPELTARLAHRGYRVCEVPVLYRARTRAQGKKLRWRDGLVALWCILRYACTA